jgi:microcompartment protein CcmL/EutN
VADAIGMIEVEGVGGIVVAADAACKAASVELMGWESIGGFTTVFVRGTLGDVEMALRDGEAAARAVTGHVVVAALEQPQPEVGVFVDNHVPEGQVAPTALGIVETRGYGRHVDVNDAMVKAADVQVANVLTVHNRVVCTLITGAVDDVQQAVVTAKDRLTDSEWFMAATVLSQPLPEVLRAFTLFQPSGGAS